MRITIFFSQKLIDPIVAAICSASVWLMPGVGNFDFRVSKRILFLTPLNFIRKYK